MSHFWHDLLFEIKKSGTYVTQINPISLFRLPGNFMKNQLLAFYGDEHKNMNFICRTCSRNLGDHSILARKGVVFFVKKGPPKIYQGNQHSLFFRFFICHPRTDYFSTGFALLKVRSKDHIKEKHFSLSHLHGMICCFEIKKIETQV